MDARARKRRGRRTLLLITVLVVGGSALLGKALRTSDDVHRGTVSYFAPGQDATTDPEVVDGAAGSKTVAWDGWGFDAGHRRHNPQARQRPPFVQVWGAGLDSLAEFPPVADDEGVYIETASGSVIALGTDSGRRRWTRHVAPPLATSPALDDRRVYVSSLGGVVLALRRSDGRHVWRYRVGARTESSPLLVDGTLYFGAEDGSLTALDARNGHVRWRVHVGGPLKGSPAYSGGLLVVGSYDGHVYGYNARTGTRRWKTAGLGSYGGLRQGHFYSTPTIAYGRVYIGSTDGRVYSLVASTGEIAWTSGTGGYVYAGPAVVHQMVADRLLRRLVLRLQCPHRRATLALRGACAHLGLGDGRLRHRLLLVLRQRHVRARRPQRPAALAQPRGSLLARRGDARRLLLRRLQHAAAATAAQRADRSLPARRRQRHLPRRARTQGRRIARRAAPRARGRASRRAPRARCGACARRRPRASAPRPTRRRRAPGPGRRRPSGA